MGYAILIINRLLMFFFGAVSVAAAAAAAVMGRPPSVLFRLALFAAVAISYSRSQRLPAWFQRLLGIGVNAFSLLVVLHAFLLDWRTHGPSLTAALAPAAVIFLCGAPLVQLLRGMTPPPLVWGGRA